MFFFLNHKLSKTHIDPTLLEWIKTMNQSVTTNSLQVTKILQENSRQLNDRLDRATDVIRDVNREVGKMSEIGRNMEELQEFLKSPKIRGNIGEQVLKDLIAQIFPKNSFYLQYQFKTGDKVDAAIKTDAGILPIDSKFPMENFQKYVRAREEQTKDMYKKEFIKDVKKHIEAIAKKYILPDEGTMDFALMYVPSEAVFYEIINTDTLTDFARSQRIFIVSPSTLYAHLQTILLSFEGKKLRHDQEKFSGFFVHYKMNYTKINESMDTLGKHLTNASSQFHNVHKGFLGLGTKLSTTKTLEEKSEELLAKSS